MLRRIFNLTLVALALQFSTAAIAQQSTASATPQDHRSANSTSTAAIKIRGCVSGGKRYTFMQASTEALFELIGENNRFASAQGKLVEISATELAPRGNLDELPKLRVKNLRVLADKCPIQARAASRTKLPATNEGPPAAAESPDAAPYADPGTETQTPPNVNNPNISGDTGAPGEGTGNPPKPPQ
jgi:hypothetical protein